MAICISTMHTYLMLPVSTDDMDYGGESGTGYSRGTEPKGSQSFQFTQQQLSNQQVITAIFHHVHQWVGSKCGVIVEVVRIR